MISLRWRAGGQIPPWLLNLHSCFIVQHFPDLKVFSCHRSRSLCNEIFFTNLFTFSAKFVFKSLSYAVHYRNECFFPPNFFLQKSISYCKKYKAIHIMKWSLLFFLDDQPFRINVFFSLMIFFQMSSPFKLEVFFMSTPFEYIFFSSIQLSHFQL